MCAAVTTPAENKALIERFWADLARRDFDAVGAYFSPDGHYTDVPAPEEGAYGPVTIRETPANPGSDRQAPAPIGRQTGA